MKANKTGLNGQCRKRDAAKGMQAGPESIRHCGVPGAAELGIAEEALMKAAKEALGEQMRLQAQKMAEELLRQEPGGAQSPDKPKSHKGGGESLRAKEAVREKKVYGWKSVAVRTIFLLSLMSLCSAYVAGIRSMSQMGDKIAQKAFKLAFYSNEPVRSVLLFVGKTAGGKPAPEWAEESDGNFAAETSKRKSENGRRRDEAPEKSSAGTD